MSCVDDILNDYMIEEWFDTQQYSDITQHRYAHCIQKYIGFTGKSPEELIAEAEEDIRQGLLPRERRIKRHMVKYRKSLDGLAPKTVNLHMTVIKSFYKNYDIDIPNMGKTKRAAGLEDHKDVPGKEVIRTMLQHASLRNKAIVLCSCSSGMGTNEIKNLKVGQFRKGYDPETEITTLHVRRGKVQYDYITFLSPEASRAIKAYLEWRDRGPGIHGGPKLQKTHENRRIGGDDDWLFVGDYINSLRGNRQLAPHAFIAIYRKLSTAAGEDQAFGKWRSVRSHNMRKYFNSALLNAGADIFFVDFLMGHKISGTHEAYYRADPESLKKKYMKYLPFLAIEDTEVHTIESEEYRKLREQNELLEVKMAKMETLIDDGIAKAVEAALANKMKESESL